MNIKFNYGNESIDEPKKIIKNSTNDVSKYYKPKINQQNINKYPNKNNNTSMNKLNNNLISKSNNNLRSESNNKIGTNNNLKNKSNTRNMNDESKLLDKSNKNYVNSVSNISKLNKKNSTTKIPKKIKHFDGVKRELENFSNAGFISSKNVSIEDESFLLLPAVSSKKKSQITMKDKLDPKDYSLDIKSNTIRKVNQFTSYYGDHRGAGRGFGNSEINNMIQYGESSRIDKDKYNLKREGNINQRQDILFKNYQDPKHLILPFPRGGEITRRTHDKRDFKKPSDEEIKEFSFKY